MIAGKLRATFTDSKLKLIIGAVDNPFPLTNKDLFSVLIRKVKTVLKTYYLDSCIFCLKHGLLIALVTLSGARIVIVQLDLIRNKYTDRKIVEFN